MNDSRPTRRHFITSGLLAGAATTMLPGGALALWQKEWPHGLPQESSAIVALLKRRLPNATFDDQSLHNYAADLIHRIALVRDAHTSYYRAIFNKKASNQQIEHFVVQDFLLRSNALLTAHLKQPIAYRNIPDYNHC